MKIATKYLIFILIVLCVVSITNLLAQSNYPSLDMPLKSVDAPEWDEIFRRTSGSGWYSGDGVFSIPFDGVDTIGHKKNTKTFWLFSDSRFCNSMDPNTYSISGGGFVNHSVAVMNTVPDGTVPTFADMEYFWGPNGDNSKGNIYDIHMWAKDGLFSNDTISMFMIAKKDDPIAGKKMVSDIYLVKTPVVDGIPDFSNYSKENTGFLTVWNNGANNTRLGSAVMDNSIEGGAHTPDGYVYVYGVRKINTRRGAVVSRVRKEKFNSIAAYEFWDGTNWSKNFEDLDSDDAEIFTKVSSDRYSVTPIKNGPFSGKYMMIYMRRLSHPVVEYRVSNNLVGPWSEGVPVWGITEELDLYGMENANVYGAKAHPHLSESGELLVSYCCNVKQHDIRNNNKNRARFFRIKLNEFAIEAPQFIVSLTNNSVVASGNTSSSTQASKAFSSNVEDEAMWQDDTPGDKWISIDLDQEYFVDRWQVAHDGYRKSEGIKIGDSNLNTKDFVLQKSMDNTTWQDVDLVVANTSDLTDRDIPKIKSRYWRIYITTPSQNRTDIANVLNVNLYGRTNSSTLTTVRPVTNRPQKIRVFPNPVEDILTIVNCKQNALFSIYDIRGKMLKQGVTSSNGSINCSFLDKGIYFIRMHESSDVGKFIKQ